MLRGIYLAGFFGAACSIAVAFQSPDPQAPTFHAGTRLVEVEVVVRGKDGPVTGLTKDNFTVLDQGKPQRIDVFRGVFRAGPASTDMPVAPLPPGAVSNRVDRLGEALPNSTVVLIDPLDTTFDLKAYGAKGGLEFIRGLGPRERVAIYTLGRNLHVLQDFSDDPAKLLAAVLHLDPGRDLMPPPDIPGGAPPADSGMSGPPRAEVAFAEMEAQISAEDHDRITVEALRVIVQHLAGMPGRRNLVWLKDQPSVPPAVMGMLLQADIRLYPVLVRTVGISHDFMAIQRAGRNLAATTGGAGFDDARDLHLALKTAEEDSQSAYTLGYYPSEDILDGRYHRLTVTVTGERAAHLQIRYKPGYVATKQEIARAGPSLADAITELVQNPLDVTGIGITARFEPDTRPELYKVRLTIDLRDVRLEREGNRSRGRIELAFPFGDNARVRTMYIDLADDQLAQVLDTGFVTEFAGVAAYGDAIRVVVRDPSTGVAGSLKIPVRR